MLKNIIFFVILAIGSCASSFANRAESVYNQLNNRIGLSVPIQVDSDNWIGGWTDGSKIVVTSGLMRIATINEVAFVIAHEMAHIIYGSSEMGADLRAIGIMNSAGYNACTGGSRFFKRLIAMYGDQQDSAHPLTSVRLKVFRKHAC